MVASWRRDYEVQERGLEKHQKYRGDREGLKEKVVNGDYDTA